MKNASPLDVKTIDDVALYNDVKKSFETMSFTDMEKKAVWFYTASSLLTGNIEYDESTLSDSAPCSFVDEKWITEVSKLLGIDKEKISKSLRNKFRTIGGQTFESPLPKEECNFYRDTFAKEIFNKVFNWLVKRLNFTTVPPELIKNGSINVKDIIANPKYYHVGLLDIFGFEIFKVNSLEQFCINYTNERLQNVYVHYVFKGEEKEFI